MTIFFNYFSLQELLRLWIQHQSVVDSDKEQFKSSVWQMAKLSQSTEQIAFFIDVMRQEVRGLNTKALPKIRPLLLEGPP